MSKVLYQGKSWKVIDTLPSGSVVLQRWVKGGIPTVFGWDVPYIYRGVVITGPNTIKEQL